MTWREIKIQKTRERLAAVEKAILEVIQNGVSYSLSGSHSVTMADLDKLRAMETELEARLVRLFGGSVPSRITATFDGRGVTNEC